MHTIGGVSGQPGLWLPNRDHALQNGSLDGRYQCDGACQADEVGIGSNDIETMLDEIRRTPDREYRANTELYRGAVQGKLHVTSSTSGGPLVLDDAAKYLLSRFAVPQSLSRLCKMNPDSDQTTTEKTVAALIAFGILVSMESGRNEQVDSGRCSSLSAWLHLTDSCPLQCIYCYVRDNKRPRPRDMSPRNAREAVRAIFRSAVQHGFSRVLLKYSGGEPLLNFDALVAAQEEAEYLATMWGLELDTVLMSCGLGADGEQLRVLREHAVPIVISLDGIGEAHDCQRPMVGGEQSFEHVARTVDMVLAHGMALSVSITLTNRNLEALPATLDYILDRSLPFSVNFYRKHSTLLQEGELRASDEAMIACLERALDVLRDRLPSRSVLTGLADRVDLRAAHMFPCAAGRHYLVVGTDGSISKCHMTMDVPVTHTDEADPLALVRVDQQVFENVPVSAKDECLGCLWRYYCAGGCPLLAFRIHGSYKTPAPYCQVYKAIMPRIVELEALRMLRYEKQWTL